MKLNFTLNLWLHNLAIAVKYQLSGVALVTSVDDRHNLTVGQHDLLRLIGRRHFIHGVAVVTVAISCRIHHGHDLSAGKHNLLGLLSVGRTRLLLHRTSDHTTFVFCQNLFYCVFLIFLFWILILNFLIFFNCIIFLVFFFKFLNYLFFFYCIFFKFFFFLNILF